MSNDSKIPVLTDLLFQGHIESEINNPSQSSDENIDFEIEQDEEEHEEELTRRKETSLDIVTDELDEETDDEKDPSVQELIIDEEIRMILDKHMDKAYAEIIRLLNNKIS